MIRPMLAKTFDPKYVQKLVYLNPKLDGIRCLWDGTQAWTRTGKLITSVPTILKELNQYFRGIPLDGELYAHGVSFQKIVSSTRRTVNIDEDQRVKFHVYDYPIDDAGKNVWTFQYRWNHLCNIWNDLPQRICLVETVPIQTPKEFTQETFDLFTREGYEGTMLRNWCGYYKFGKRSSDLMKIKTFEDAEFEIVGLESRWEYDKILVGPNTPGAKQYADGTWYKNGAGRQLDTCGRVQCKLPNGETFGVGTGLDEAEAKRIWDNPPIGKMLTVKFQGKSDTGVPRFPVYKWIREEFE